MAWKTISSKTIFTHPRITLIEDNVELPDGQQVPYLVFEKRGDSACIICTQGDKVLLQQEYSYPPNEVLYQFPGGKVEANETAAEGAIRELAEEAGLHPKQIVELGWFYTDNRRTSARMYVYLASDCIGVKKEGGDKEENITDHWTPILEVDTMIRNGQIVNYSLLAAWSIFTSRSSTTAA